MSSVTWVYILLGLYIVYSTYEGMKGFFQGKDRGGLCDRRTIRAVYCLPHGCNRSLLQRLDLYRPSGPDLAGWSGLCICLIFMS